MGRKARDEQSHVPPVERIELNKEHMGRRLAVVLVLLAFGIGMLTYSFVQFLSPQAEWITVEAGSSVGASCGGEFEFFYRPGGSGRSYAADRKAVTALYTQLCRTAYEQFHNEEGFEGVNNVYAINRRPNEVLEVDDALYNAFAVVEKAGSRLLYLGPVYGRYDDLFLCEDDSQLVDFDPRLSEDVAREYREVLAFANDPEAVRLELLGGNKVCLRVSEAYLEYAAREGIHDFIEFSWTRNAFIADYLAEELADQGYTFGVLSSYDGFVRNLDGSGTDYTLLLYDRTETGAYAAAKMEYGGPMSVVSLRDYPVSGLDMQRFYQLRTGEFRTMYLDPADALCRSAVQSLVCYTGEMGCGELLLRVAPVYIAEELRAGELEQLAEEGIQSVLCENGVVCPTDPDIRLNEECQVDGRYIVRPQ